MIYILVLLVGSFVGYLIYLIFFWQWKKNCQPFYNDESALIMGHRGSPTIVTENTLRLKEHIQRDCLWTMA